MAGPFTFGIEEEYFLVDAETKSLVRAMPQAFLDDARSAAAGRISQEFLQPQIEVISSLGCAAPKGAPLSTGRRS